LDIIKGVTDIQAPGLIPAHRPAIRSIKQFSIIINAGLTANVNI